MDPWQELESAIVGCRRCSRLVSWREDVAATRRRAYREQTYWGRPVPGFGDPRARVLIVGLAPGAHGANRTGRLFTGDSSGDFLFSALHRAGWASQRSSRSRDDGMVLKDVFISAVCRCAPPDNRPANDEVAACLPYLVQEIDLLKHLEVIVALGRIAFDTVMKLENTSGQSRADGNPAFVGLGGPSQRRPLALPFAHGAVYPLAPPRTAESLLADPASEGRVSLPDGDRRERWLVASYHPSRQNTQTGRLTSEMFDQIWEQTKDLLQDGITTGNRP